MASPGSVLRAERDRQGRTIDEIAQELCITPGYLRAIEADKLSSLPGAFFYKSFVRQYALALGVDADAMQPDVQSLVAGFDPAAAVPEAPIRVPDAIVQETNRFDISNRSWALPVAGLAIALVAGSGFYAWWKQPAAVVISDTAAVEVAADVPPASTPEPAAPEPTINVTTSTGTDGVARLELNLSAKETTWLSISSAGKEIFSGVLRPDETKTVSGLEMARLTVGNAGGLNVQWNGKEVGPLGEKGQVRVVVFTPEGFKILASPASVTGETL